jgi:hypothetical protein
LYVVGEPAVSVPAASVALRYGAYEVPAAAVAVGDVTDVGAFEAGAAASPCPEHAAVARASRQPSPAAAGFR